VNSSESTIDPGSISEIELESSRPTVDRLFDTAAELFWEKGFAATTTREIAAKLNIQQASLYYHVASKEDLLYRLCKSSIQEILAEVQTALSGTGFSLSTSSETEPQERIRTLIRAHVKSLLGHQKRNATMLMELRSLTRTHRPEIIELRDKYTSLVQLTLEEAQAASALRTDISAAQLRLALLNMLNWSALWYAKGQERSAEDLADLFAKVFLSGAATVERKPFQLSAAAPKKPRSKKTGPAASTVDRLLKAAVALFSTQGYTATSTREVASLLGMQKASLYYHIQSKEDLLYFICKASLERIRADVESAIQDIADPLERTRTLIRVHIESMLRDAEEHTTTLAEMHALSRDRLAKVVLLRSAYEDLVRSVLRQGQGAGVIRADIDAKYLSLFLLGLMNRVLVWYRKRGALSPRDLGQVLAEIYLTGATA
jgi:AcrR family transcriptional regulator